MNRRALAGLVAVFTIATACSDGGPDADLAHLTPSDLAVEIPEASATVQIAVAEDVTYAIVGSRNARRGCFELTAFVEGFAPSTVQRCLDPSRRMDHIAFGLHDGCFYVVSPRAESQTAVSCDFVATAAWFGAVTHQTDAVCLHSRDGEAFVSGLTDGGVFVIPTTSSVPATPSSPWRTRGSSPRTATTHSWSSGVKRRLPASGEPDRQHPPSSWCHLPSR